jgi:hypothetical protein
MVFVMEVNVVFFGVGTELLNVNYMGFRLKSFENLLQNTTDIQISKCNLSNF